jgi:hypothetical protein
MSVQRYLSIVGQVVLCFRFFPGVELIALPSAG